MEFGNGKETAAYGKTSSLSVLDTQRQWRKKCADRDEDGRETRLGDHEGVDSKYHALCKEPG
jgi:hypothetical protein